MNAEWVEECVGHMGCSDSMNDCPWDNYTECSLDIQLHLVVGCLLHILTMLFCP